MSNQGLTNIVEPHSIVMPSFDINEIIIDSENLIASREILEIQCVQSTYNQYRKDVLKTLDFVLARFL